MTRLSKLLWTTAATLCLTATAGHAQGRGNGGTPPGLAKKGGLPPGQAKKVYRPDEGVVVLTDIFSRHGYIVIRTIHSGDSRVVFYRTKDGRVHRAYVRPGTERLVFESVPEVLLREVLARMY